jgi:NADPH:quinone reductase
MAKYIGANVIATVSNQEKADLVKKLGADHVVLTNHPVEENIKKIIEITKYGVDVSFDGVGKDTWEENFEIIKPKGTIVTFGNASVCLSSFIINEVES